MLLPLLGARLHGWLDELVPILYVLGIYFLHLHGLALGVAIGATARSGGARFLDESHARERFLSRSSWFES